MFPLFSGLKGFGYGAETLMEQEHCLVTHVSSLPSTGASARGRRYNTRSSPKDTSPDRSKDAAGNLAGPFSQGAAANAATRTTAHQVRLPYCGVWCCRNGSKVSN